MNFDSKFEEKLSEGVCKGLEYHKLKVPYISPHVYEADWTMIVNGEQFYIIEAKGYFKDSEEAKKYINIRDCLCDLVIPWEIVFIFENYKCKKTPATKRRKDGTFQTMAEWADKHGFKWFTPQSFQKFRDELGV